MFSAFSSALSTRRFGKEAILEFKRLVVGFFETNCYLLFGPQKRESVIIDPAGDGGRIMREIGSSAVRYILITHGHGDHTGALEDVWAQTHAPVGIHRADAKALKRAPDFFLEDGQILVFGEESLTVLHTPGHSPGGVGLLSGKILFSGDTIFPGGHGNTDLPGADEEVILESIHRKVFTLPDETTIYPGHGLETTVGHEKSTPFYPLPRSGAGKRQ